MDRLTNGIKQVNTCILLFGPRHLYRSRGRGHEKPLRNPSIIDETETQKHKNKPNNQKQ